MGKQIRVIGVPMDFGSDRRGVDMGPSAIRYAGLANQIAATGSGCSDLGDMTVPRAEERDPDSDSPSTGQAKFLNEIQDVCERLGDEISRIVAKGLFPLTLGGDHSIAIGSMQGTSRNANIGVLWFDAHGDFNTPSTSPSGNVHGMSLAASLGRGEFAEYPWAISTGLDPENIILVGTRDLDEEEREELQSSPVTVLTMTEIDQHGVTEVVGSALEKMDDGIDGLHVSLDLDWLDPDEAPGVGTPVRGGVTYREAHAAMETIANWDAETDGLRSMDIVEVNPILDQHNRTAELATELASSVFGRRII